MGLVVCGRALLSSLVVTVESISIAVALSDENDEDVVAATTQLRSRFLELDVDGVENNRDQPVPLGSKPGDAIMWGALTITMAPALLQSIVQVIQTWLQARPNRGVKLTIGDDSLELTGTSAASEDRLVEEFIAKHSQ